MEEFQIPDYILISGSEVQVPTHIPSCPVIVFINSRSGGQLGGDLLKTYRKLLNKAQVFDLSEEAPDKVLCRLYANFEKLKSHDDLAAKIQDKLRLIVAGGDGTASWLLGVVSDLKLAHPPPVATVPLGTGNNLPFSFGWGKKNPGTDDHCAQTFLAQVKEAKEMKIDSWHIIMRMKAPKEEDTCDPIAPLELPHSLHAFQRVSSMDSHVLEGHHTFRGGFWNYFSMGLDAEVSYSFHSERKKHPEKFKNQLTNQATYAKIGFRTIAHPSPGIAQLANVKVIAKGQDCWTDLSIDPSIKSIVCLNLPSFSGGFNPWGTPSRWKKNDGNFTAPFVDDGLLEVVGFRDAGHGLVLLVPGGHGTRLAQAHRIRFEFHKGAGGNRHTYMRIDGEPWKQPLPADDDTVMVEISHHGQVNMLASGNCRSRGKNDSSPSSHHSGNGDNSGDDELVDEKKKFGAAETFKVLDDDDVVDIAHLS